MIFAGPRLRQARHQHAGDRRARPVRAAAAAQHPQPARLRGRRHRRPTTTSPSRPEVDPKRVAVMGYSFGGYHAPRIAAFDKRYAACVAFGAMHWSIYDWVAGNKAGTGGRSAHEFDVDLPVPLGGRRARQRDRARNGRRSSRSKAWRRTIECPFLVLHGENDRIVPVSEAQTLYEQVGSKRKHLKIFTAEEGGAEHCQVDHRQLRRRLHRRLAAREHVRCGGAVRRPSS